MGLKNLFDFMGKKVDLAEISPAATQAMSEVDFKELALHIGITYIANALSKCEIKTFRNGKENKGLFYYLLNVSPNPNQNASQFMHKLVEKYYTDPNGALVLQLNDRLYVADSFTIDDSRPLEQLLYENVTIGNSTLQGRFKASEVYHFKLDDECVKSYIDRMNQQYGTVMAMAIDTFRRKNGRKYKLLVENFQAGDEEEKKRLTKYLNDTLSGFLKADNGVLPEYRGRKLEEFGKPGESGSTADIIAMRKEIFDTAAQAMKIPLPMMYGNITNLNEVVKVFLSFCIDPIGDIISEEFTRKRHTFEEWKSGNYVLVDTSCINYVDILEVAEKLSQAIGSGVTNIDELRDRCNLPVLDTEFSTAHFITKNYDLANNMLKQLKEGERKNE